MASLAQAAIGRQIQDEGFIRYSDEIRKRSYLSPEDELRLARLWRDKKDPYAFRQLSESHLRLVVKIAAGYGGYGIPLPDLVSEGNVGLINAINKFDPERGFRLSTYAMWWIRASVTDYVLHHWSSVGLPRTAAAKKLFFKLKRIKSKLGEYGSGEMSDENVQTIATTLSVSKESVVDMNMRMSAPVFSLDTPMDRGEGDTQTHGDTLVEPGPSAEESYGDHEEMDRRAMLFRRAAANLNPRERAVVAGRHLREPCQTLAELADVYKVSRERIRQIENKAMDKLKKSLTAMAAEEHANAANRRLAA